MKRYFYALLSLMSLVGQFCHASPYDSAKSDLYEIYNYHCQVAHNINEHMPTLKMLAQDCSSVVEIGVFNVFTTWALLQGLSESSCEARSYIGIDIINPPFERLKLAENLANAIGINFQFWQANDLSIDLENVDLLFIDSLHTYCHLTTELEKFSPYVNKYIAMHDTSAPWGTLDDCEYRGNYSEYLAHIDRNKRGLWPAVEDFLSKHPEWSLHARYYNNHGFTILKRKDIQADPLSNCPNQTLIDFEERPQQSAFQRENQFSETQIDSFSEEVFSEETSIDSSFHYEKPEELDFEVDLSIFQEIQGNQSSFLEYS